MQVTGSPHSLVYQQINDISTIACNATLLLSSISWQPLGAIRQLVRKAGPQMWEFFSAVLLLLILPWIITLAHIRQLIRKAGREMWEIFFVVVLLLIFLWIILRAFVG